jgi:glycosyltransferase involved in cell wall biosynthesis
MNPPCVTVVMPLFNKASYVRRALASVLGQTFQEFEVVVVNDGSTDGGPDIVRQIQDPRIRLFDQKNVGVSAARNRGIREARSELVAFLDADDEWMPAFLDTVLNLRANYPEAGAYATAYRIAMPEGVVRDVIAPACSCDGLQTLLKDYFRIAYKCPVCSSAVAIPLGRFVDIGYFREGVTLGEDVDMWLRIAAYSDIAYSRTICAVYHFGGAGSVCQSASTGTLSLMEESLSQITADARISGKKKDEVRRYVRRYRLAAIRLYCLRGDLRGAKRLLHHLGAQSLGYLPWLRLWAMTHMPPGLPSLFRRCDAILLRRRARCRRAPQFPADNPDRKAACDAGATRYAAGRPIHTVRNE